MTPTVYFPSAHGYVPLLNLSYLGINNVSSPFSRQETETTNNRNFSQSPNNDPRQETTVYIPGGGDRVKPGMPV